MVCVFCTQSQCLGNPETETEAFLRWQATHVAVKQTGECVRAPVWRTSGPTLLLTLAAFTSPCMRLQSAMGRAIVACRSQQ